MDFIKDLPDELSLLILSYVSPTSSSISHIAQSCSLYKNLIDDSVLWKGHLDRHFPLLQNSIFCLVCYSENIESLENVISIMESSTRRRKEWITRVLEDVKSAAEYRISLSKSKSFFAYLQEFVINVLHRAAFATRIPEIGIALSDFSLLRWVCLIRSLSVREDTMQDVISMKRITTEFPSEFPNVCLSESDDIRLPVQSEYFAVDGPSAPGDLSFESIGSHSNMSIRGVSMRLSDGEENVVRCMSSLRLDKLVLFRVMNARLNIACPPLPGSHLFESMKSLERLHVVRYTLRLSDLNAIANLSQLQSLHIGWCSSIIDLPSSFLRVKNNLKVLNFNGCDRLKSLPESIGELRNLEVLELRSCSALESIPSSIEDLKKLRVCALSYCSLLKCLPSSIGGLTALRILEMNHCLQLSSLPPSVGDLINLQELYLCNCTKLKKLPSSLGGLSNLNILDASSTGISKKNSILRNIESSRPRCSVLC